MLNLFDWFYKKKYNNMKKEYESLLEVVEFYDQRCNNLEKELEQSKKSELIFKQHFEYVNNTIEEILRETKER